jgi:hypothetical protein
MLERMRRTSSVAVVLLAVLGSACAPEPAATGPAVHAMPVTAPAARGLGEPVVVHVSGEVPVADVGRAMAASASQGNVPCYKAVFVWGSLRAMEEARPMRVSAGGASLAGFVVCEEGLPQFLAAQKDNPRLVGAHGGSADLRWGDGQLYLRRSWSGSAEAALGDLSADTSSVLQKGELLAAVFDPHSVKADATGTAEAVVAVMARVPKFFLFGMWPLPAQ